MTSLLVNIIDDSKVNEVVRFLTDIPFLEVIPQENSSVLRIPDLLCKNGKIKMGADFDDELPELFWAGDQS